MPICDRCIHINECGNYSGILSLKPTATRCRDFVDKKELNDNKEERVNDG